MKQFMKHKRRNTKVLEKIYMDICSPFLMKIADGFDSFNIITDDVFIMWAYLYN